MSEWRPIETLKSRDEVILYYPPLYNSTGRCTHGKWVKIGRNNAPRKATHWMPLPEPPK